MDDKNSVEMQPMGDSGKQEKVSDLIAKFESAFESDPEKLKSSIQGVQLNSGRARQTSRVKDEAALEIEKGLKTLGSDFTPADDDDKKKLASMKTAVDEGRGVSADKSRSAGKSVGFRDTVDVKEIPARDDTKTKAPEVAEEVGTKPVRSFKTAFKKIFTGEAREGFKELGGAIQDFYTKQDKGVALEGGKPKTQSYSDSLDAKSAVNTDKFKAQLKKDITKEVQHGGGKGKKPTFEMEVKHDKLDLAKADSWKMIESYIQGDATKAKDRMSEVAKLREKMGMEKGSHDAFTKLKPEEQRQANQAFRKFVSNSPELLSELVKDHAQNPGAIQKIERTDYNSPQYKENGDRDLNKGKIAATVAIGTVAVAGGIAAGVATAGALPAAGAATVATTSLATTLAVGGAEGVSAAAIGGTVAGVAAATAGTMAVYKMTRDNQATQASEALQNRLEQAMGNNNPKSSPSPYTPVPAQASSVSQPTISESKQPTEPVKTVAVNAPTPERVPTTEPQATPNIAQASVSAKPTVAEPAKTAEPQATLNPAPAAVSAKPDVPVDTTKSAQNEGRKFTDSKGVTYQVREDIPVKNAPRIPEALAQKLVKQSDFPPRDGSVKVQEPPQVKSGVVPKQLTPIVPPSPNANHGHGGIGG